MRGDMQPDCHMVPRATGRIVDFTEFPFRLFMLQQDCRRRRKALPADCGANDVRHVSPLALNRYAWWIVPSHLRMVKPTMVNRQWKMRPTAKRYSDVRGQSGAAGAAPSPTSAPPPGH